MIINIAKSEKPILAIDLVLIYTQIFIFIVDLHLLWLQANWSDYGTMDFRSSLSLISLFLLSLFQNYHPEQKFATNSTSD